METRKPVHETKQGRVRAAIWANETNAGLRYSVTVGRLYKAGDKWKTSHSLGADELPLAIKALEDASAWIGVNISANPQAEASAEEAR